MRIAFMGTPEFAVPSLRALHDAGYEVAGVFTQPDRPAGRGHKLVAPPVKVLATELALPVFQYERVRKQEGIDAMRSIKPDLIVTAAFGQILSKVFLAIPKMGTVNVHASLLPAYRGPAPIAWCILNGEQTTGVTTMYTDVGIDTGDMIYASSTAIGEQETTGALTERLSHIGADLLLQTLRDIEAGTAPRVPQDHDLASHHPMLTKELGKIDWQNPATSIDCLVRGCNPWPCAYTYIDNQPIKIWKTRVVQTTGQAGIVLRSDSKQGLFIGCGEGSLEIVEIQSTGKNRIKASDWLRGNELTEGSILGGRHERI